MIQRILGSGCLIAAVVGAMACSQGSKTTSAGLTAPSTDSLAATTAGNGAPKGKHVFSWNLIGTPHDYQGGCGDGRRIFVNRDVKGAQILIKDENDGWSITDCNATGGHLAEMHSDDLGIFNIYARILGKPGGTLDVCVDLASDIDGVLCSIGTINLKRDGGQSKFKVQPDALFDAELEDLLWTVDTNKDFRIVQFRVYQEQ